MNTQVAIVGGGPAGLMLACELGTMGVRATVFDRLAEPSPFPPGVAINTCSVELLDQRGLMDALKPRTFPLPQIHFALLTLNSQDLPERFTRQVLVNQYDLERALEQHAEELGAVVRRGSEITSFLQLDGTVVATMTTADGSTEEVTCDYLVGCDGGSSTVRRLAGIPFIPYGDQVPMHGLIADVETSVRDLRAEHQTGARYQPSGSVYMGVPLGPDVMRMTTWEPAESDAPATEKVSFEELSAATARVTGRELEPAKLRWGARCTNVIGQAERYRDGRVFLAGDAAQVIFPYNGQALHNALQDAVNLAWKLAATLRGTAPADLLDTYHAERHAAGERVCMNIHAQVAISQSASAVGALRTMFAELIRLPEANQYLAQMMTSLDVYYPPRDDADAHRLVGRRLPPVRLKTSQREVTTTELLRAGRGILLDLSGAAWDPSAVAAWCDRVDVVTGQPLDQMDTTLILARPDGHIGWAGEPDGAATLPAALTRWFGPAAAL
jgi:2-polyprenyl-6-methoxyphenol hydroxylase-like FAD-dependent oxidoreductase